MLSFSVEVIYFSIEAINEYGGGGNIYIPIHLKLEGVKGNVTLLLYVYTISIVSVVVCS